MTRGGSFWILPAPIGFLAIRHINVGSRIPDHNGSARATQAWRPEFSHRSPCHDARPRWRSCLKTTGRRAQQHPSAHVRLDINAAAVLTGPMPMMNCDNACIFQMPGEHQGHQRKPQWPLHDDRGSQGPLCRRMDCAAAEAFGYTIGSFRNLAPPSVPIPGCGFFQARVAEGPSGTGFFPRRRRNRILAWPPMPSTRSMFSTCWKIHVPARLSMPSKVIRKPDWRWSGLGGPPADCPAPTSAVPDHRAFPRGRRLPHPPRAVRLRPDAGGPRSDRLLKEAAMPSPPPSAAGLAPLKLVRSGPLPGNGRRTSIPASSARPMPWQAFDPHRSAHGSVAGSADAGLEPCHPRPGTVSPPSFGRFAHIPASMAQVADRDIRCCTSRVERGLVSTRFGAENCSCGHTGAGLGGTLANSSNR